MLPTQTTATVWPAIQVDGGTTVFDAAQLEDGGNREFEATQAQAPLVVRKPCKTKRMERRLTHWMCSFCRSEMAVGASDKCSRCGGLREHLRDEDAAAREAARLAARAKEHRGRTLNARGKGSDVVPRVTQGVFESVRHDALVAWETREIELYTGASSYVSKLLVH